MFDHSILVEIANGRRIIDPADVKTLANELLEWRRVYREHDPAKFGRIDAVAVDAAPPAVQPPFAADDPPPLPLLLWCPGCGERHIDRGIWASKLHHTHACQNCGMVWRPAIKATVGVVFLPGFKDQE